MLGVMDHIERPTGFSCYILIELWSGPPPLHPSGPARTCIANDPDSTDSRRFRIIYNPCPFDPKECQKEELPIHTEHEVAMGEFSVAHIVSLIERINNELSIITPDDVATRRRSNTDLEHKEDNDYFPIDGPVSPRHRDMSDVSAL